MAENPEINTEENHRIAVDFIKACVEKEKEWAAYIFKDIETFTLQEYYDYVEYLANITCRNAGIQEAYPENTSLKSPWVIKYGTKGGDKEAATKQDFFQTNVIGYGHESGGGFDL
ncbi:ribonucleotide-diphosphate reductase subunit beta [compost metagenome]